MPAEEAPNRDLGLRFEVKDQIISGLEVHVLEFKV